MNLISPHNTYDGKKVVESFYECVNEIVPVILDDRRANTVKFTEVTDLSTCDERVQKLYRKLVQAVKEELKEIDGFKKINQLAEDSPYFIHFVFKPAEKLLTKFDKEQPGGTDFLIQLLKNINYD